MGPLGTLLADQGALGEDETRATVFGSLGVVFDVVVVGNVGCWVLNQLLNSESDPEYPRIDRFLVKEAMSAPFFALSAPSWTDLARLGNLGASDIFGCSVSDEAGDMLKKKKLHSYCVWRYMKVLTCSTANGFADQITNRATAGSGGLRLGLV
jgi:hypothetical protein